MWSRCRRKSSRLITYQVYDAAGRLTDVWLPAVTDADVSSTTYEDSVRPHWQYTYDSAGNQLTQVDPKGHTTTFEYDQNGNQVSRTLPDDEEETFTYDQYGRQATHVDFDGHVTACIYDGSSSLTLDVYGSALDLSAGQVFGRLIEERRYVSQTAFGSGTVAETTRYAYDELGRQSAVGEFTGLPSSSNAPTRLEITTYDPIGGQVTSVESPEGTINYEYDDATGLHTRTYTDNSDTTYDYDLQGRLWHVTVTKLNGTTLSPSQVTTYGYDPAGNLTTVTYEASGVVSTYDYDALNRLDHLTVTNATEYKLFEQDFTLSADGKRESVVEQRYDGSSTTPFSKAQDHVDVRCR